MKFPCRSAMMVPREIMYFYNHSSAVRVLGLSIMEFVNWFGLNTGYTISQAINAYSAGEARQMLWVILVADFTHVG